MEILDDTLFSIKKKEGKSLGFFHRSVYLLNIVLSIYVFIGQQLSIDYKSIGTEFGVWWWEFFSFVNVLASWSLTAIVFCFTLTVMYFLIEKKTLLLYSLVDKFLLLSSLLIALLLFFKGF